MIHSIKEVFLRAMLQKLKDNDPVTLKEPSWPTPSRQVNTLIQLPMEKELISREEFFLKVKEVQSEYESRKAKG
jgi:hypothetical protein